MRPPEFWNHRDGRDSARITRAVLTPLSWLYRAAGALQQVTGKPSRPRARVICVGNLTLGGVGKTPVVIAILNRLQAHGVKAVALTRGYRGRLKGPVFVNADHDAHDVGDEALLLARVAPTIVSQDRAAGALLADEHGFEVIVMDDGFQNPSLTKDFSIVVVEGDTGFGNRCIVPAGPLREPVGRGLARAHALLYMRSGPQTLRNTAEGAEKWRGAVMNAWLEPEPEPAENFKGKRLVVFAGIGRPQKVFETFARIGANVIADAPFPDHHHYSDDDIDWLHRLAKRHDAALATTEKDLVRLSKNRRDGISALPVRVVFAVEPALDAALAPLIFKIEAARTQVYAH